MNTAIKYPKTFHFPFSKGLQNDDRMMEDVNCFDGKRIAVTVKMDGENTSMYRDGIHARSLSSVHHPSRSVVKGIHSTIKNDIPVGWRICGENMYARHSIHYTNLKSFFYVFSVWNENNECLSWKETKRLCKELNLTPVECTMYIDVEPIRASFRYDGLFYVKCEYDYQVMKGQEGIVVRNVESYHYNDFHTNIAKAVRANHITSNKHWTKNWIPNLLTNLNNRV